MADKKGKKGEPPVRSLAWQKVPAKKKTVGSRKKQSGANRLGNLTNMSIKIGAQ